MPSRASSAIVAVNPRLASELARFDIQPTLVNLADHCAVEIRVWENSELVADDVNFFCAGVRDYLKDRKRSRVLISGAHFENHVTVLALRLLAEGLDTYLLRDLVFASFPQFNPVHETRLFLAGVVPTTLVQMLMEWIASESDPQIRSHLSATLATYSEQIGNAAVASGTQN